MEIIITSVWIALGIGGEVPSDQEVRARLSQEVTGHLVVEATVDGAKRVFSAAPVVKKGRRRIKTRRWPRKVAAPHVSWFKLESDPIDGGVYDNTGKLEPNWHPEERADHPKKWHWCPIDYVESDTGWGSVWSHKLDAIPTTTPNDYKGLGTMRYVAAVRHGEREVLSRGKEHRDKTGLRPGIATVRFRLSDTPVGYMTELINVPYVYGSSSASGKPRDHQAERAVGADCADLVVYGWRRHGRKKLAYTWTGGLKGLSKRRVWVDELRRGEYLAGGRPVKFGRDVEVGDILLWKGHVAVLAAKDPTGYLTPNTQIMHTVQESAALIPFKAIGFGFDSPAFDVRRFRWQ